MADNNDASVLSKEATAEILGDNLSFVIAFGVNGEVVQYFPHGVGVNSNDTPMLGTMDSINISLDNNYAASTIGFAPMGLMSTKRTAYWCFKGGKWVKCNTPC